MNKVNKKPTTAIVASSVRGSLMPDAALARYMSELSGFELLSRSDEIALAQDVERLEVAYWHALLSHPSVVPQMRAVLARHLEELPAELNTLTRIARKLRPSKMTRAERERYDRASTRLSAKLRELDVHREIVKDAHVVARLFAGADVDPDITSVRPRPTRALERYLTDIEEARRAQQESKDRFVSANLRLVVSMARRYARNERMPLADLIQEGNLGLMKAVERFDYRRGFRFSTYASWWIRHALTRGLADKGRIVRLPVHALEARARIARVARKLKSQTGIAPNLAELAGETGLAPEKVTAAEELSTEAHFSLDAPVGNDTERTFVELLRYEDQRDAEELAVSDSDKESLKGLMGQLTPFEAQILRYRYGFDGGEERTLKEIGDMYNLSRERIRQIQALALAKMRARMQDADERGQAAG